MINLTEANASLDQNDQADQTDQIDQDDLNDQNYHHVQATKIINDDKPDVGIKRLLDDIRDTVAKFFVTAAN
ncbi:hypothetical protein Tco_0338436 [Tanacetum coccineum]